MTFTILNLSRPYEPYDVRVLRNVNIVTQEKWNETLLPFSQSARYKAANLAAHNWDVFVYEGDLVMSRPESGYVYYPGADTHVCLNDERLAEFYPKTDRYAPHSTICWKESQSEGLSAENAISRTMLLDLKALGAESTAFIVANTALIHHALYMIDAPLTKRETEMDQRALWERRTRKLQMFWNAITIHTEF